MEDATALGFPSISLFTNVYGKSWDASVYAGLCQFHQAKGFDPDSQGVARHLGDGAYQLSSEMDVPFAQVDDEDYYSDEEDQDPLGMDGSDNMCSFTTEVDGDSTPRNETSVPHVHGEEDSCAEEKDRDLPNIDMSEDSQHSTEGNETPKSTKTRSQETEPYSLDDEMPVSRAFKFFMDIQLALIMFLALCWLYDHFLFDDVVDALLAPNTTDLPTAVL
ncbi:hypothetical protein B0H13DRAFT_2352698 [Mycena leptocephala]|nr:hypothetical protein B0H13DRAFT_2352698 [Mycena leptocephala]